MSQKQSERNLLDAIRVWAKDSPSSESLCQVMQTLGANIKDAESLSLILSNAFGGTCLLIRRNSRCASRRMRMD